jgi:hypothetical protein
MAGQVIDLHAGNPVCAAEDLCRLVQATGSGLSRACGSVAI